MSSATNKRTGAALVVGVGNYLHSDRIPKLPFAARDAKAMARLFADPEVCGFPESHVALLVDQEARRDKIVQRLSKWLPERSRGAEIALIYFAGHGMVQRMGRNEEGYLLAHDADPEEIVTHGVAMSDITHWIDAIEAGSVVVILDCCHAGKILTRDGVTLRSAPRDMGIRPAVLQAISGKGRFLIASCDDGQKSIESRDLKHGLFTYHLLRGIGGAADRDGDGKVGVAELFNYVSAAVARDAREKFALEQQPWTSATWTNEIFIAQVRARAATSAETSSLDRLWRQLGPADAMAALEERLRTEDEPGLRTVLRYLRPRRDPAAIPLLFHCLAHPTEAIRRRAKPILMAFGWEAVAAKVIDLARHAHDERGSDRVGLVLDGLAAIEARAEVVGLLERLLIELAGGLRTRAMFLLDRKRLGLQVEQIAALFRERSSPYRIEKVLGQGSFTAVYLATHVLTGLPVVVRVLRSEFVGQPPVLTQFLDTSKRSFAYVHQSLVHIRDVQALPDHRLFYTVRDYVDGVTLQNVLSEGKRFEPLQVLEILHQALGALTPLHREETFHGGIKPSNVFLCKGERVRVILGDPSVPLALDAHNKERLCYDYRYAPPEFFRGDAAPGPRSDFYALGCLIYELLCGAPPFTSDNPFDLVIKHLQEPIPSPSRCGSTLGPAGDALVMRLLARSPADRFTTLEEALETLDDLRFALRARSAAGARPVTILGRDSLARYEEPGSLMAMTGWPGPPAPSDDRVDVTILPQSTLDPRTSPGLASQVGSAPAPEPVAFDLSPGELFGRYQIVRTLGRGGMGTVYLATDSALDRQVALKIIDTSLTRASDIRERFRREARALARVSHPGICPIFDVGEINDIPYICMGYIEGPTLGQIVRDMGNTMPERQVIEIIRSVADTLDAAHRQQVIHRDLKPHNVMIGREGHPVILDFGLARLLDRNSEDSDVHTGVGMMMGTPGYMAPEQIEGNLASIGPATDIYSLGATLYVLLTGHQPFEGPMMKVVMDHIHSEPPRPSTHRPDLDPRLEAICLRALAKRPEDRFSSMADMSAALGACLDSPPPSGPTPITPLGAGLWQSFKDSLGDGWRKLRGSPRMPGPPEPPWNTTSPPSSTGIRSQEPAEDPRSDVTIIDPIRPSE